MCKRLNIRTHQWPSSPWQKQLDGLGLQRYTTKEDTLSYLNIKGSAGPLKRGESKLLKCPLYGWIRY